MSSQALDLETYFERDIIEFLDKKKQYQETEAESGSNAMLSALESNNVALAEKILEETISQYNELSMHDVYKEIQFKKILEMVRQSIDFLNLHPQQNMLRETVELLVKSGELSQGPVEKIKALEQRLIDQEEAKINAEAQEMKYEQKLLDDIKDVSQKTSLSIRKKDLHMAILNYKELKTYFEQFPSKDLSKKQDIYNDMLSFFMQINKLKKELEEQKHKSFEDKKRLELATTTSTNKYLRIAELNNLITQIKDDVKKSDFSSAEQKIMELRQITGRIPDSYKHIRAILNSKIDVIVQRVQFVKRMKNHN